MQSPQVKISFVVAGPPIPAGRPRFLRDGRAPYNTRRHRSATHAVGLCAQQAMQGRPPLTGPVELHVTFAQQRIATAKPDLSNYIKLIEDACNGIVYRDDAQIVSIIARKQKGDPHTIVSVQEIDA